MTISREEIIAFEESVLAFEKRVKREGFEISPARFRKEPNGTESSDRDFAGTLWLNLRGLARDLDRCFLFSKPEDPK